MSAIISKFQRLSAWRKLAFLQSIIVLCLIFCATIFIPTMDQHFAWLADSFLHGHTYFIHAFGNLPMAIGDLAAFNGKYYWPLGPFPAAVMMPFTALGNLFGGMIRQNIVQALLLIAVMWATFSSAKRIGYRVFDAWMLAYAFTIGSGFLFIIAVPDAWQFAQAVAVLLTLLALHEYFYKKRYLVIGILLACVLMTRVTGAFGILFFALEIAGNGEAFRKKLRSAILIVAPLLAATLILAFYNYARFGNFLQEGYSLQILTTPALARAREYGLFGLIHLPGNLFYAFLYGPLPYFKDSVSHVLSFPFIYPDLWGMGIFFSTPYHRHPRLPLLWHRLRADRLSLCLRLHPLPLFCLHDRLSRYPPGAHSADDSALLHIGAL
jgi:hypothetical protein